MSRIAETFRVISEVLVNQEFENECLAAEQLSSDEFVDAAKQNRFSYTPLIELLCEAFLPDWRCPEAAQLENDLRRVVGTLGPEIARSVFRDKILTRNKNALEDTRYEIFATARACEILDAGSVELERPIPGSNKNSDIYGTFQGKPVRIEVTVLHENHDTVNLELVELLERTPIPSGFTLYMRKPLKDEEDTRKAIEFLRALHEHHIATGGKSGSVFDHWANWTLGAYEVQPGLIQVIRFHPDQTRREVRHPAKSRSLVPKTFREIFPKPDGVKDLFDVLESQDPLSKKIRDTLQRKLQQCEPDTINLVAFGNPSPREERDLRDALHGGPYLSVGFNEETREFSGDPHIRRVPYSPFQPAEIYNEADRQNFIDPFRILSGVWHIRLGRYRLNQLFENPNASVVIPPELHNALRRA